MLRAAGTTRAQVTRSVLAQGVAIALVAVVPAVPVGIGMSWLLHLGSEPLRGFPVAFAVDVPSWWRAAARRWRSRARPLNRARVARGAPARRYDAAPRLTPRARAVAAPPPGDGYSGPVRREPRVRRILRPIPSLVFAAAVLCGRAGLASDAPSAPPSGRGRAAGPSHGDDVALEEALVAAGKHRPALEAALAHFATRGEPAKAAAARFLVANMPGKGYIVTAWKAKDGTTVTYDPLAYPTFKEAVAAFDALEAAHGAIDSCARPHRARRREDDHHRVPRAARGQRVRRVAQCAAGQRVAGPAFAEHVLPYRGSEEPLEDGDAAARALRDGPRRGRDDVHAARAPSTGSAATPAAASGSRALRPPPDRPGLRRDGAVGHGALRGHHDMYAARARGLAVAADYTPAWGHRDNNDAWPVPLDASGRGSEAGNAHAAKVYRKVLLQRDGLPYRLPAGREPPNRFLASKLQVDVTPTGTATDRRGGRARRGCCRRRGPRVPLRVQRRRVGRDRVGADRRGQGDVRADGPRRDGMLYLPAVHDGKDLRPARAPRVVGKDGAVTVLAGTWVRRDPHGDGHDALNRRAWTPRR